MLWNTEISKYLRFYFNKYIFNYKKSHRLIGMKSQKFRNFSISEQAFVDMNETANE